MQFGATCHVTVVHCHSTVLSCHSTCTTPLGYPAKPSPAGYRAKLPRHHPEMSRHCPQLPQHHPQLSWHLHATPSPTFIICIYRFFCQVPVYPPIPRPFLCHASISGLPSILPMFLLCSRPIILLFPSIFLHHSWTIVLPCGHAIVLPYPRPAVLLRPPVIPPCE